MPTPRYSSRVVTRVGLVTALSSAAENEVEDRILQLAADIGGDPAADLSPAASSLIDAIGEVRERAMGLPTTLGPGAFRAMDGADAGDRRGSASKVSNRNSGAALTLECSLDLINGSVIDNLEVYGRLTASAASVEVVLSRYDRTDWTVGTDIATLTLTGSTGILSDSATSLAHTVNTADYAYRLQVTLTNDSAGDQAEFISAQLT